MFPSAVVGIASLLTVAGAAAPALGASGAYDAAAGQACQLADNAIYTPGLSATAGSAPAWTTLASTMQVLASGTADPRLATVFGGIVTTATGVATAIQAGSGTSAARAAYDTSVATVWGACTQLTITKQKVAVKKFTKFTYEMGAVVGPPPLAAKAGSLAVNGMVLQTASAAKKANRGSCLGGAKSCGYFVQTLTQDPCVDGLVCVRQQWGLLAVGANSSEGVVDTMAIDASTGTAAKLSQFVPASAQKAFLASVNAALGKQLKKEGLGGDPVWKAKLTMKDITAWLPEPDGMHLWFDKYAVAPGYLGVVSVVVPLPVAS